MSGPGQPTDPGAAPPPPPDEQPPATAPPPSASTPPPAGTPPPTAGGAEWGGKEEKPPEWVQQAQNWRPAEVAAGPAPGVAYADLTTRIIAYIIDAIILSIGYFVVFSILLSALLFSFGGFYVFALISAVLYAIGSGIYFVYTWTTMRASPGQKVLNLQTVSEKDGATLTQNQAITRWAYLFGPAVVAQAFSFGAGVGVGTGGIIGTLISLAVLGYYIYLIYTTANDPKRQGFHDKQSGTVVVKTAATPAV